MIKVFELYQRRPGADTAAYLAELTTAMRTFSTDSRVCGFTVQQALPLPARKDIVQLKVPTEVDAFIEIWADSRETYQQSLASATGATWRRKRAELVSRARSLVLREHALIPVPAMRPPARNNAFLTRHARLTHAQFMQEWVGEHGAMCRRVPHLRAFVPCEVLETLPQHEVAEMDADAIEGIAQAYFDSPEKEMAMIATPEAKEWFKHGAITFGLIKAYGARELAAQAPALA